MKKDEFRHKLGVTADAAGARRKMQMTEKRQDGLPRLAFGEAQAIHTTSVKEAADRTARMISSFNYLAPIAGEQKFHQKVATIDINGLVLQANAMTPVRMDAGSNEELHFCFSFRGRMQVVVGGKTIEWNPGAQAVLYTRHTHRAGEAEIRSCLLARLSRERLIATARAMLGEDQNQQLRLEDGVMRLIDMKQGGVDFATLFSQICQQIDNLYLNRAALERLGVDDMFYRHVICLLKPELLSADAPGQKVRAASTNAIDAVCSAIQDNSARRLTYTQMEQISGLSARSLHYAFQKKFGCSPMDWQQREKLQAARRTLMKSGGEIDLQQLSRDLGFSTPLSFAHCYFRMFGETPAETLLQSWSLTD